MASAAGESKNINRKLDVEIYCNQEVLMGLGMIARVNQELTDLGNATLTYKGNFATGYDKIPQKSGDLAALCQYGLPDSYVKGKIENIEDAEANLILIQRDINPDGSKGSKRSISLIQVTHNPDSEGHVGSQEYSRIELQPYDDISPETTDMNVLVLGSQKIPNVKSRQMQKKIYARGGNVLKAIQYLGSKLAHGIVLYGLETVITLYYKFGWRFVASCGATERSCKYEPAVKALYAFLKENGVPNEEGVTRKEKEEADYNRELTSLLRPFAPFAHDMYGLLSKTKTLDEGKQAAADARETARDDGYRMLLCPKNNPYSVSPAKRRREESKNNPYSESPAKRRRKVGGNKETEEEFEQWVNSLGQECYMPVNNNSSRKGKRGGRKKKRRRTKKNKRTKKKAPKKRHRKSKKARKSKKKSSWCKSSKSWCKYTKKNNCKKGLWSKKTKLGRASRKWCKVTKRWCKVNDKTCKKRR